MEKTPYYSWKRGTLADGCRMCTKGKKLVLFVTGLCGERCYYCPISEEKKGKEDIYANEWKISSDDDILEEARLCSASGAGITGGDPLLAIGTTVRLIRLLKSRFGERFHIHLYTPLRMVTEERLTQLYDAGLDEIRFHPDLDDESLWERIRLARSYDWDVGIEIPALPGKEQRIQRLIESVHDCISFLNLNELEYSDTNAQSLGTRGFVTKDSISYGISGSEETALALLTWADERELALNMHYCTATLKDKVQLSKRVMLRSRNVKKPYDKVTACGTLIRGAVYLDCSVPGSGYHRKIVLLGDKSRELASLGRSIKNAITITDDKIGIDLEKKRVLVPAGMIKEINRKLTNICAVVEEYPTKDGFEVEIDILSK